jgi:hypothetical protein
MIFEDPALEGALEAVIHILHRAWAETRGRYAYGACPRFNYPFFVS